MINNIKGDSCITIDPTELMDMVVELEEDTKGKWMVIPAGNLNRFTPMEIQDTIDKLGLNSRIVINRRTKYAKDFIKNIYGYSDREMAERQPFVFRELRRLGRI